MMALNSDKTKITVSIEQVAKMRVHHSTPLEEPVVISLSVEEEFH
jgi:hypothetical protein